MKVKTLSAGMVVTHQVNHECRYLLLRAYNYWDFPKGIVEPTEDPFEAARREVEEETSLRNLDFPWGQVFRETEPYGAGKVARYYLAATQEVAVTLISLATLWRGPGALVCAAHVLDERGQTEPQRADRAVPLDPGTARTSPAAPLAA